MKLLIPFVLLALAGCDEDQQASAPDPAILTEDAAGHYCQMEILEHDGPKAQVHLAGYLAPLWFSQVRDGLVYLKSPEQSAEILAFYVNDMGAAVSWSEPGPENWINAVEAFYVVGSDAIGGMGAPEIVPFGTAESANSFVATHGGIVQTLDEIPAEVVLAPIEFDLATQEITE